VTDEEFERAAPVVHAIARSILGDEADAWDVVDSVFAKPRLSMQRAAVEASLKVLLVSGPRNPAGGTHAAKLRTLAEKLEGSALTDAAMPVVELGPVPALEPSVAYQRAKAKATARRPPRWRELLPFIVPVLAGLGFLVIALNTGGMPHALPAADAPELVITRLDGGIASEVHEGELLHVALVPKGYANALVLSVDKDRRMVHLEGETLEPRSSLTVHAFFSRQPLDQKRVEEALEQAMKDYAGWPLDAPAPGPADGAVSTQRIYVTP
jgi:hypothetical protein